ncbi:MAG: hypothetical protein P8N76_16355 [Pirellulaceae bacterium]|nr:hypothetical protein [Pirellulaceae bacterium]
MSWVILCSRTLPLQAEAAEMKSADKKENGDVTKRLTGTWQVNHTPIGPTDHALTVSLHADHSVIGSTGINRL